MSTKNKMSRVVWRERMTFDATTASGRQVVVDATHAGGGDGRGPTPVELVMTGLAGCTAMDIVSLLRKMRQPLEGLEVEVGGERRQEEPRIFTHIEIVYRVKGKIKPASLERAIQLSHDKYCTVGAMLEKSAEISTRYEIESD